VGLKVCGSETIASFQTAELENNSALPTPEDGLGVASPVPPPTVAPRDEPATDPLAKTKNTFPLGSSNYQIDASPSKSSCQDLALARWAFCQIADK